MSYKGKKTHIHPFHAYTFIGITLFVSIWLISLANPNSAQADDQADFSEIITEKDNTVVNELLKPDTVLPIGEQEEIIIEEPSVPVVPAHDEELVVTILPKGKHQNVKSEITIISSTDINISSLEKAFTIVPNVPGTFRVNGRVASFVPDRSLSPQTKYTVSLDTSLYGSKGQRLTSVASGSFETEAALHMLSVPYYRQQHARSCEAASLRMALAYLGTVTNDLEIVKAVGYNPTIPNWTERTWDNPYEMFVGYLDGPQVGYGMYAQALAKAAKHFGHDSKVLINPQMNQIASEVRAGHPVVVWGYISGTIPKLSYFTTPAGERIPIYSNEHARVITGVVGSTSNPVGFYLNDPLSGASNEYWTKEKLEKHMGIFGAVSNQALVVK